MSLALMLSVVGIYGVMSFAVSQRAHKIDIRMALGVSTRQTLDLVLKQAILLAGIGIVPGLGASFAATRLLERMLFGVTTTDPLTFAAVPAVLLAAAFIASYIPARRATRVDPLIALRYE